MIKCNCLPFQLQSIVLGDGYIYEGGLTSRVTILNLGLKVYRLYRDVIITFYLWEKEFFFINMSVTSGEAQKIFS